MIDNCNFSLKSLRRLLTPVIKLCLKKSIGIVEITEVIKSCMVEAAKQEIELKSEKLNASRLSVMTGLQRRDVTRILEEGTEVKESLTLVSRVIGQWENDARFKTKNGLPKNLSCDGKNSEFARLVSAVSKDVHHGTVMFELKRLKLVEVSKAGVRFIRKAESLKSDPEKAFQAIAADISDLIDSASQNIYTQDDTPNLQARTEYDNVFKEDLPKIKEWLLEQGSDFHRKAREFISKYDKDLNPHIRKEAGCKVSVSAYSLVKERE